MTRAQVDFAWRTDRGRVRARNEDSVAVHEETGVAVIADGIGGASSGNLASRIAVNAIYQRFVRQAPSRVEPGPASQLAQAAVDEANAAILEYVRKSPDCAGMGTTVVIGYFGNTWLAHAHVGDSRLYRLRDGQLVQLTRDHSFIQEVVDQGFFPKSFRGSPLRHQSACADTRGRLGRLARGRGDGGHAARRGRSLSVLHRWPLRHGARR